MPRALPILLAALLVSAAGCSPSAKHAATEGDGLFHLNEGYSLLYRLVSREKDVDKLLLIKVEEGDVGALITKISATALRAATQFETFAEQDARIALDLVTLPLIEQKTRSSIAAKRATDLLLSTGWQFELQLLLTQVEALSYGTHLAAVLAESEIHSARKTYLGHLSKELEGLRAEVLGLIAGRYRVE